MIGAVRPIHDRLALLRRDIQDLTTEKLRLEKRLNRVVTSRKAIMGGLGKASARVVGLRQEHLAQAKTHRLLMEGKASGSG